MSDINKLIPHRKYLCDTCKYSSITYTDSLVGHARGRKCEVTTKNVKCILNGCCVIYSPVSCEYYEEELVKDIFDGLE